jgi:hypothetical protein
MKRIQSGFERRLKHYENEFRFLIRFHRRSRIRAKEVYTASRSSDVLWNK